MTNMQAAFILFIIGILLYIWPWVANRYLTMSCHLWLWNERRITRERAKYGRYR